MKHKIGKQLKQVISLSLLVLLFPATLIASQPVTSDLRLSTGTEVSFQYWPGKKSQARVLWLGSDNAFPAGMVRLARALNAEGLEMIQVDILAAHFLPALPSSLDQVPDRDLAALLQHMLQSDQRSLVLMADGLGAKLLVRAAEAWRQQFRQPWPDKITTTVLISPNLYVATPVAGAEAEYIRESGAPGGQVVVLQPQLSPQYWWLERLQKAMTKSSAAVDVRPLPGVRDRFYFRPDASAREQALAKQLPGLILQAIKNTHEDTP